LNSVLFGALGATALLFGALALITGSLTPISLLVADMVVMGRSQPGATPNPARGDP
jgi:hypothetical protein